MIMTNTEGPRAIEFRCVDFPEYRIEIEALRNRRLFLPVGAEPIRDDVVDDFPTVIHVAGFLKGLDAGEELVATGRIHPCLQSSLAWFERVAVSEQVSRDNTQGYRHVGRSLLEFLEACAQSEFLRSARVLVREKALEFYKSANYKDSNTSAKTIDGREVPVYVKDLS